MTKVRVDGAELFYRVDGPDTAPAIVFSNSLGCDLHMWDAQVAVLKDRFRVVRYDTRGHGQSTCESETATLAELASDLLAVIDNVGVSRAHLCGLSLGGTTALWLAAYAPERFDHVVFANTGAKIGTADMWNERMNVIRHGGMETVVEGALERFLGSAFRAQEPHEAQRIEAMLRSTSPRGYLACCAALRDTDLREPIRTIAIPSLIVASEFDVSTPPGLSHDLHESIQGSTLSIIPNGAHLSNVQSRAAFNDVLLNFLPH